MKFSSVFILLFIYSCSANYTKYENRTPYNSKGFAFIYKDNDFQNKIIKIKMNNKIAEAAHHTLKPGVTLKIINPKNNKSVVLKNSSKTNFSDFYKILITKSLADEIGLSYDFPLVEVLEIKKNKSFVAQKAKIFKEERTISNNAPVDSVQILNISKNKKENTKTKINTFNIKIASFYYQDVAKLLIERIKIELPEFNMSKIKVIKKSDNEINLISGPYNTVNLMKNDYILLKKFGFEELEITANE